MTSRNNIIVLLFSLILFHTIFFEFSITSLYHFYTTGFCGNDWLGFYGVSQFFSFNQSPSYAYSPIARTSLYYIANGIFLKVLGNHFWVYQLGNAILAMPFFFALYLLSKKLFNPKIALFTVLLAFFNPFIFKNVIYPHSKILAAFFVLMAIYFYLNIRESNFKNKSNLFLCGASSGLAYLSHQIALVFVIGLLIDYFLLTKFKITKFSIKIVGIGIATFLIIVAPWYLWAMSNFGLKAIVSSSPPVFKTSFLYWIYTRFHDFFTTLIPIELFYYVHKFIIGEQVLEKLFDSFISFYVHTIFGAIALSMTIFLLYKIKTCIKKIKTISMDIKNVISSNHGCISILVIVGFIGGILTIPAFFMANHGIAMPSYVPLIPLLLIYLAKYTYNSPFRNLLFTGIVLEFLFTTWSQLLAANLSWKSQPIPSENTVLIISNLVSGSELLGNYWVLGLFIVIFIQIILIICFYKLINN